MEKHISTTTSFQPQMAANDITIVKLFVNEWK